ncbi:hypothetical protein [Pseudoalteromonas rubra]|uniref:hypothetical protein n=1 Tax=Pseudoalteromonas rubra TaxID=43658 RepID=UPI00026CB73D|nr:hypothetical protein [Pseudoalteromonas rubra]
MNMNPIGLRRLASKKLKVATALICATTLTAGISIASEDNGKPVSVERAESPLHARNGGPSLRPVKPTDNKSIIQTIREVFG